MKINIPPKWDGFWRIVIFDVPEKLRKRETYSGKKIKTLAFFPLQKSVFVYPFDCRRDEINGVREFFFGVGKSFTQYIVAKEIDSENF